MKIRALSISLRSVKAEDLVTRCISVTLLVYDDLVGRINAQLDKLKRVMATDVPAFDKLERDQNVPAVFVKHGADGNR